MFDGGLLLSGASFRARFDTGLVALSIIYACVLLSLRWREAHVRAEVLKCLCFDLLLQGAPTVPPPKHAERWRFHVFFWPKNVTVRRPFFPTVGRARINVS